jgi:hypothetical protein
MRRKKILTEEITSIDKQLEKINSNMKISVTVSFPGFAY